MKFPGLLFVFHTAAATHRDQPVATGRQPVCKMYKNPNPDNTDYGGWEVWAMCGPNRDRPLESANNFGWNSYKDAEAASTMCHEGSGVGKDRVVIPCNDKQVGPGWKYDWSLHNCGWSYTHKNGANFGTLCPEGDEIATYVANTGPLQRTYSAELGDVVSSSSSLSPFF